MGAESTQVVQDTGRDRVPAAPARFVAVLMVACALVVGACGDDSASKLPESSGPTAIVTAPTAAAAVCASLRSFTNTMVDHANAAAAAVSATSEPATRSRAIDDGFARLIDELDPLASTLAAIAFPEGDDWDALRADLLAAPEDARAELVDERAALAAVGPISDDDEPGRVGQFFNAIEKVSSIVEPTIRGDADPTLRDAFGSQPDCRFVASISPPVTARVTSG